MQTIRKNSIILMLSAATASCGAFNRKDDESRSSQENNPEGFSPEFLALTQKIYSPNVYFRLKRQETRGPNGMLRSLITYGYNDSDLISKIEESYDSQGSLLTRRTSTNPVSDCSEITEKTEDLAKKSVRVYRTSQRCDDQGRLVEAHEFRRDNQDPESEISSRTYERNSSGRVIKRVEIENSLEKKVKTTVYTFDSNGYEIEAVSSEDGKPVSRVVTDPIQDADTTYIIGSSGNLDQEREYLKQLPRGHQALITFTSSSFENPALDSFRARSSYSRVEGSCALLEDGFNCKRTESHLESAETESVIEYTLKPLFVPISVLSSIGEKSQRYVNNNQVILDYMVPISTKTAYQDGKPSEISKKLTDFNSAGNMIRKEEIVTSVADGKTVSTIKEHTYDSDGYRILKSAVSVGGEVTTTIYTY